MKKIIITIGIVLLFVNCSSKPNENEFMIRGSLTNAIEVAVYLQEITPYEQITLDTAITDKKGNFSFKQEMPYQSLYVISAGVNDYITLLPDYTEIISVTGDYTALSKTYKVEGSKGSLLLWELNNKNLEGVSIISSLSQAWNLAKKTERAPFVKDSLDHIYDSVMLDQRMYVLDFINKNTNSLSAIIGIYKMFNGNDLLNVQSDFPIYEKVAVALQKNIPENPHIVKFVKHVQELRTEFLRIDALKHQEK